jgi:hypothetical protein
MNSNGLNYFFIFYCMIENTETNSQWMIKLKKNQILKDKLRKKKQKKKSTAKVIGL